MIILLTAAAAAATLSTDSASVRVPLSDLQTGAPRVVLAAAAQKACRAIGEFGLSGEACIEDATAQAMRDYRQQLRARRKVLVLTRR